jgi:hypothetical protein
MELEAVVWNLRISVEGMSLVVIQTGTLTETSYIGMRQFF